MSRRSSTPDLSAPELAEGDLLRPGPGRAGLGVLPPTAMGPRNEPDTAEVVEAATAEAAIAEVHERLGPDARILDARRVLRGGVGGFFAREVVQLTAAPGGGAPGGGAPASEPTDARSGAPAPGAAAAPAGSSPVDRLLAGADEVPDAVDFATFLRRQLDDRRAAAPRQPDADLAAPDRSTLAAPERPTVAAADWPAIAAPDRSTLAAPERPTIAAPDWPAIAAAAASAPSPPPEPEPEPATPDPAGTGTAWSTTALIRLGVPAELVRGLDLRSLADDLAWFDAVAEAVRPSCRPLPTGPAVLIGDGADAISEVTGEPVARSRTWKAAVRPGRWVHLVVGGPGWRELLDEDPLAVSWSCPEDLPEALRCATELGLVLGYGPGVDGRIRRARPVDVAMALRGLLEDRREER